VRGRSTQFIATPSRWPQRPFRNEVTFLIFSRRFFQKEKRKGQKAKKGGRNRGKREKGGGGGGGKKERGRGIVLGG